MNADITIGNPEDATLFATPSGQLVRVKKGKELLIVLNDVEIPLTWGTTADPVLDLKEQPDGTRANVKTISTGKSKILLLNDELQAAFHINVEVFDPEEVTTLNPTTSDARQRQA